MKLANLLKHQALWFFSSSFGIAHNSANLSNVLISSCGFIIMCLLGAFVSGKSSSRHCLAVLAFSSRTELHLFGHLIAKSGRWLHDHSIVGTHGFDPSSLCLGVQIIPLRCCQASKYGQRSGSGDVLSECCNPICRKDVVQFLTGSVFYLHQLNDTLQPQKECFKWGHSSIPPVCPK